MNRLIALTCAAFVAMASAKASDTIRICTYNILKYAQSNEDGRIPQFKRILDSIRPHIMLNQEVADNTAGPRFVSEVLTWAPFAAIPFVDGPDTESLLFYDQTYFDLVSTRVIPTELRNILEVTLALRPHDATLADTVVFYSVHLKASDGTAEATQRLREVTTMINAMTTRPNVFICGDFNIYSPNEQAYTALTSAGAMRRFVDPLGNSWRRNDASFSKIYTQCTRKSNVAGCGGGVDGGLDDRFDLILASQQISSRVLSSTYTSFGNDGVARLNESIDEPPNTIVSAEMAAALKCASDHLPSYVDVILGDIQASVEDHDRAQMVATWDAPYLVIEGLGVGAEYHVYSTSGSIIASMVASSRSKRIMLSTLSSGVYTVTGPHSSVRFVVVR